MPLLSHHGMPLLLCPSFSRIGVALSPKLRCRDFNIALISLVSVQRPHHAPGLPEDPLSSSADHAGFDSLNASNAAFLPLKRALLTRASLDFERTQCTPEQQGKVDRAVTGLLQLLVPFFLSPAAVAVLEYLIRKYKCACMPLPAQLLFCSVPLSTARLPRAFALCFRRLFHCSVLIICVQGCPASLHVVAAPAL